MTSKQKVACVLEIARAWHRILNCKSRPICRVLTVIFFKLPIHRSTFSAHIIGYISVCWSDQCLLSGTSVFGMQAIIWCTGIFLKILFYCNCKLNFLHFSFFCMFAIIFHFNSVIKHKHAHSTKQKLICPKLYDHHLKGNSKDTN